MRILDNKLIKENYVQTQLINEVEHKLALVIEVKLDKTAIINIPWAAVKKFAYVDDIFTVGINGEMIIENVAGILDPFLNNSDQFFIGFYLLNQITGFEENIYFSIISANAIEESRTSNSCLYNISLKEAFLVEGSNRNVNAMGLAVKSESTNILEKTTERVSNIIGLTKPIPSENTKLLSKNIHDLAKYALDLIKTDIKIEGAPSDIGTSIDFSFGGLTTTATKNEANILDIDEKSFEYFKNTFPSDLCGEAIFKNIGAQESVLGLLEKINQNIFLPKVEGKNTENKTDKVNLSIADCGTLRSENLSNIRTNKDLYSSSSIKGERRLTIRNYKDTFSRCFQDNSVYEIMISPSTSTKLDIKNLGMTTAAFLSPTFFNMIKPYPVNISLTNNEWCDCLVAPINQPDVFSGTLYRFTDIVNTFNNDYLHKKAQSNILVTMSESRGISAKVPPFNDNTLNFAASAKIIRTFFTLNNMIQINLPGNNFRKANEIIFIDKNLLSNTSNIDSGSSQTTFGGTIDNSYYFVTRVIHSFSGQVYTNDLYLSTFCKELSTTK